MHYGDLKFAHEDSRRKIEEFNCVEGGFSVQGFTVKEKIPLGNHYHAKKTETFVITRGQGYLVKRELNNAGEPMEGEQYLQLDAGSVVRIPPYTAHTFFLDPGSEMICLSSSAFDENDKDMHAFPLNVPMPHGT